MKTISRFSLVLVCIFSVSLSLANAPKGCSVRPQTITQAENALVFSEWGHINASFNGNNFKLRIVKDGKVSGYSLWFCDSSDCYPLLPQVFYPIATDDKLKQCKLFERLINEGIAIPSNYKWKMIKGPYPLQFNVGTISEEALCSGAKKAFTECLGI